MTTLNFAFARGRTLALVATLIAVGLAGCESGSNLLSNNSGPEAQIAQPAGTPPSATKTAKMQIAPVIGAPESVARDIQTQLAAAVGRSGISVATEPNGTGEYIARGYIVAAREATGSKISYIWDLTDQAGKRVHRITGEEFAAGAGKDPWGSVSAQVVKSIADKTAAQIASWLPKSADVPVAANSAPVSGGGAAAGAGSGVTTQAVAQATPQAAAPASTSTTTTGSIAASGPVTALVPNVTGAPGDGSQSLTGAIQRELSKSGVTLASAPDPRSYKVEGKVTMGQGKDGKQPITIDWSVVDPSGRKLGTVSQKNEVPQGSLDGAWGKTADAAAQAAAAGIVKLLPQQKTN